MNDPQARWLVGGVFVLLCIATAIGQILKARKQGESAQKVIANLNARTNAWWVMCAIFGAALLIGRIGTIVLFALMSFIALREFITLTPSRRGDHRSLFWAFFILLPIQYILIARQWYGMFTIFIPVYAYLFIPIRCALAGDNERFLERTAKIQWGLMVCVYFVSYAPALLTLQIPGYVGQNAKLLFFFAAIVQLSDVLQYVFGKLFGRHPLAPKVSPNKTLEGFVGGILAASLVGMALWRVTPFSPLAAFAMSLAITLMGFFGGLTMSAIKRDRGVKDYGELLPGHGGMMDRIDSLCFAAPIFFHLTRYFIPEKNCETRPAPGRAPIHLHMKLFNTLMSKIFGAAAPAAPASAPAASSAPSASSAAVPSDGSPAPAGATGAASNPGSPAAAPATVDVDAVLSGMAAKNSEDLDWKKSIVDLMKLVGMDSSLSARKELATELGYTGDKNDSATMNEWLHKQVLRKLAENGGKIPQNLLD